MSTDYRGCRHGAYPVTSEGVSAGHPDKVADQIADAILDAHLWLDPHARVACEVMVTKGHVIIAGECASQAHINAERTARETIRRLGYDDPRDRGRGFSADGVRVLNLMHSQSPDIARGVAESTGHPQGAGDQGMMYGYATNETGPLMPLPLHLCHLIMRELDAMRRERLRMPYLMPDAKCQVTVARDADTGRAVAVDTIVLSTQHTEFVAADAVTRSAADREMQATIARDVAGLLLPRVIYCLPESQRQLFDPLPSLLVNPAGRFVEGGPAADTGLTGRKIIADTYGGAAPHGGGAFSGKDPSKVDRSGAYAARHIARNIVAAGAADEALVQVAYAIGRAEPVSLTVRTRGRHTPLTDEEIAKEIGGNVDLTPAGIARRLGLLAPIYGPTSAMGHFGHGPRDITLNGRKARTFTWEEDDLVPLMRDMLLVR